MPVISVVEYDPAWPDHFKQIAEKLSYYLNLCGVEYLAIEHVGSTAVAGLIAKPIIDIIIEVPDACNAELAKEALVYEPPPEAHYKCIGDGGIRGRLSMKFQGQRVVPSQSV
ncbi:hypothetical protein G647_01415 [Cladophialophora carrionii CBS 160.54]|uniref:GrpB family protein n=1 Tax=Cladophialophora carrionii CBS 160.54 TaxID=1279043 RepID=V9DRN8_9EURO|nr:uncharacterized protein G647_01415 [Cladophialophora carrionii CBS 160.54]ETI28963.1 hypothetical protein G647_01415 [Cladophialophora carrionii CBS 160.54]